MSAQSKRIWKRNAQANVTQMIYRALIEGYREWMKTDPTVYDAKENSVTVRLLEFAQDAVRHSHGVMLAFSRDEAIGTPAIRAGKDDPNRSPRPDMVVKIQANQVGIVECKWVDRGIRVGRDAANYVKDGIGRFVPSGEYTGFAQTNVMVGYLIDIQRLPERITGINQQIDSRFGAECRLMHNGPIWAHHEAYQSQAATLIQHLFFAVPQATDTLR